MTPPEGRRGTVVALVGRYFARRTDLLTREGFKTLPVFDGSPFTPAGRPDPTLGHLADREDATNRVATELHKDLRSRLRATGADYLVVDNSGALLRLAQVDGRFYSLAPDGSTNVTDLLGERPGGSEAGTLAPPATGLTDELAAAYDAFVDACLAAFAPERIILLRSHVARFWIGPDGRIAPTEVNQARADLIAALDDRFLARTGSHAAEALLHRFPSAPSWHVPDALARAALESEIVGIVAAGARPVPHRPSDRERRPASDHVIQRVAAGRTINRRRVRTYFEEEHASADDLVALAYLEQECPGEYARLLRACARAAVNDVDSVPVAATRQRFERSLEALRSSPWRTVDLPGDAEWRPQVAIAAGSVVLRFLPDGVLRREPLVQVDRAQAERLAAEDAALRPVNVRSVIGSWAYYLERARRGRVEAPVVAVSGPRALLSTCAWLDWHEVLANEDVVIVADGAAPGAVRRPPARTDLSFVFAPSTRIGTVGGGLMDQVTHIALFRRICDQHGLDLYLDDLRYTWWRSHNGFEASRLCPDIEGRRLTRRVSPALLESFRAEMAAGRPHLPWLFNQTRALFHLGLGEAFVVTRDYFNARRLPELETDFPYLIYPDDHDLERHLRQPPAPVTLYTTQHRIAIAESSAATLSQLFSFRHLEDEGLPEDVAATAAVLTERPHVAVHVRRGDYLDAHFDTDGWFARQEHYVDAMRFLIDSELGTSDIDVAVFSDDIDFVAEHAADYGLDLVTGRITYVRGNRHFDSIFDSYLMALCPVIVGSVGFFAATTSLLASPPSTFVRASPAGVEVEWRRRASAAPGAEPSA